MGNSSSSIIKTTPLAPQPRFPRVVNQRFVKNGVTSLRLPIGFWANTHDEAHEIVDADTNQVVFKVPRRSYGEGQPSKSQLLLDHNGVPVVSMEAYPLDGYYTTYVPTVPLPSSVPTPATWQEHRALCYIETSIGPLETPLVLTLPDPGCIIGYVRIKVEGSWRSHQALVWAERGVSYQRECIARVYVDSADEKVSEMHSVYRLDVAPGVDIALLVLICAVLGEEMSKTRSEYPVEPSTDEITTMLKERHFAFALDSRRSANAKGMFVSTIGNASMYAVTQFGG